MKYLRSFLLLLLCFILILSTGVRAADDTNTNVDLKKQQEQIKLTYLTGTNTKRCVNILNGKAPDADAGSVGDLFQWANIFNPGYWIPVVPTECVVCQTNSSAPVGTVTDGCPYGEGVSVPLPLNLMPHMAIRLYGLLASITIYGLILAFAIVGVRYLVGGLAKGGRYTDTAKNLRDVFSATLITLVASTLFLQILYNVLRVDQNALTIKAACIPGAAKNQGGCEK